MEWNIHMNGVGNVDGTLLTFNIVIFANIKDSLTWKSDCQYGKVQLWKIYK